jgi:peptidyl-prolyl cis-trans isomerase D
MALIGKIREKSWLLILIIGLALLAFILSDYKSIMGGYSDQYGLGTVYGTKVSNKEDHRLNNNKKNLHSKIKKMRTNKHGIL